MTDSQFLLILLSITLFSGILKLYHHFADQTISQQDQQDTWISAIQQMFPVFLIQLFIFSFIVSPFKIPSGSMIPTLQIGDYILVKKYAYDINLPYFNITLFSTDKPKRGDVIVFKSTSAFAKMNNGTHEDMIKRVVGLPGETIRYEDKKIYVNDIAVDSHWISQGIDTTYESALKGIYPYETHKEKLGKHLLNIKSYPIIKSINNTWVVPKGMYFVIGDNRDLSDDSRYWGCVPEGNIIGQAFYIWLNWVSFFNTWPTIKNNRLIE